MPWTKYAAVAVLAFLPVSAAACSSGDSADPAPTNNTVLDNRDTGGAGGQTDNPGGVNSPNQGNSGGGSSAGQP